MTTITEGTSIEQKISENEYVLVSIIFKNHDLIPYVNRYIPSGSLLNLNAKELYLAILKLKEANQPIEELAIYDMIKNKCPLTMLETKDALDYAFPSHEANPEGMVDKYLALKREYDLRQVNITHLLDNGYSQDAIKEKVTKLVDNKRGGYKIVNLREADEQTQVYLNSADSNVMKTGIYQFDNMLQIKSTNLIVLAARPKQGKTTFALNMAVNAIKQEHRCLYFSFEMSIEEITQKLMSRKDYKNINKDKLKIIESASLSVAEIKTIMLREQPDMCFVDQLDCIPVINNNDRHDLKIGKNVSDLKKVCMDIKIPIVLLHQLNRDADKNGRPALHNLKDTGVLEQKADAVLMLWKEKREPGETNFEFDNVKLIVGANRMNASGDIMYVMQPGRCLFEETEFRKEATYGKGNVQERIQYAT